MEISNGLVRKAVASATALLLMLVVASVARCCDTPVYRYAMYRWFPAPYEVYCFHKGDLGTAGEEMKSAVSTAAESAEAPSNIVFVPVDLEEDKELAGVPPDVKEAWQAEEEPALPQFLVSSPVGGHLFMGSLSPKDLPPLLDSPMRQRIGDLIKDGKAGVYVLLKSADEDANVAAEKVLQGVVDDVASGKIQLYTMPPAYNAYGPGQPDTAQGEKAKEGEEKDGEEQEENESGLSIGLVTLSRDTPREKWFVDSLLALEPDLRESKEPIVFMIYGRGRALFSCLGKGIRRDNLIMDVEFITGACSCTVKNMNPGVDLLMSYDWEAAAEALYRQHGVEEGSPYSDPYGSAGAEAYPELIVPPEGNTAGQKSTEAAADADGSLAADVDAENANKSDTAVAQADSAAAPDSGKAQEKDQPDTKDDAQTAQGGITAKPSQKTVIAEAESGPTTEVAARTPSAPSDDSQNVPANRAPRASGAFQGIMWVGGGLLGVLAVLFGITFIALRPK